MVDRHIFLDANILLHYTFFDEIDWPSLSSVRTVQLVLPYTIIRIMDEKKYVSSDSAVKERAKSVIAKLDEISERNDGGHVRDGVTLVLLPQEPAIDYSQFGLNRQSEDDRLIANILLFRQSHPEENAALATADLGLKLKCKQHDIPLVSLPDEYLLPVRADAQGKRIKELEVALSEARRLQPKLHLYFPNGKNFIEIKLIQPETPSDENIRKEVENSRQIVTRSGQHTDLAIRQYIDAYKHYLAERIKYVAYCSNAFSLRFVLSNAGTASAEDTDVYIEAQGKFSVMSEAQLPPPPKPPAFPSQKSQRGPFADFDFNNFENISASIVPLAKQLRPPNVSDPTITRTPAGYKIHFHIQRVKQSAPALLDRVFIHCPLGSETKSFSLDYTINSHSLPNNVTGELHIKLN